MTTRIKNDIFKRLTMVLFSHFLPAALM